MPWNSATHCGRTCCDVWKRLVPGGFRQLQIYLQPLSSYGKHFLQNFHHGRHYGWADMTESLSNPFRINRPKLVNGHKSGLILKAACNTPGVGIPAGRHRRHNKCPQMLIQFIRRDNQARTCFLNLTSPCGVELNQANVPSPAGVSAYRHCHSSRSNFVDFAKSINRSSPRSCIFRAASGQPIRAGLAERMKMHPGSAFNSISSASWASSIMVFGKRMPREFPI